MKFTLKISMNNDTYSDDPHAELAYNMKGVLRRLNDGHQFGTIYDSNGNSVGGWEIE